MKIENYQSRCLPFWPQKLTESNDSPLKFWIMKKLLCDICEIFMEILKKKVFCECEFSAVKHRYDEN